MNLPRAVEADPRADAVRRSLADVRPLWPGATHRVPRVAWTPALAAGLRAAVQEGRAVLGLEAAEATLDAERAGLERLAARGTATGERVSRVAVLACDGAERFYRGVERLLRVHGARLLPLVADVEAAALGAQLAGPGRTVKLVLLTHREAVSRLLLALA